MYDLFINFNPMQYLHCCVGHDQPETKNDKYIVGLSLNSINIRRNKVSVLSENVVRKLVLLVDQKIHLTYLSTVEKPIVSNHTSGT